jgi:hypothetical protein
MQDDSHARGHPARPKSHFPSVECRAQSMFCSKYPTILGPAAVEKLLIKSKRDTKLSHTGQTDILFLNIGI